MKQETSTPADRLLVLLQTYALALLLAMFISALHAGILFSLGDFLEWLGHWARPTLGERPADILVVLVAISGLFVAHICLDVGSFFLEGGPGGLVWRRLVFCRCFAHGARLR